MSLRAAVNAIQGNYNWNRDRNRHRRDGLKWNWQYLKTCDPGTCPACDEAGRYLFSDDDFPGSPIPGCTNSMDGCRCLAMGMDPKDGQALIDSGNYACSFQRTDGARASLQVAAVACRLTVSFAGHRSPLLCTDSLEDAFCNSLCADAR